MKEYWYLNWHKVDYQKCMDELDRVLKENWDDFLEYCKKLDAKTK